MGENKFCFRSVSGYKTYVVVDATRPVAKETGDAALEDMKNLGE